MIYCDLDETLIARWQAVIPNEFVAKLTGMPVCRPPVGESGWEIVAFPSGRKLLVRRRPSALEFLAALRQLGSVKLLTDATQQYAETMNAAFGLGFEPSAIIGREQLDAAGELGQAHSPVDPEGILIENEDPYGEFRVARWRKGWYLGLRSSEQLIYVPRYDGDDSDRLAAEMPKHVAAVAALILSDDSKCGHQA
ncbi:hypothetical protein GALL_310660 [mine drainage metagenome]|uniref:HAD family hydrolase n=1 Tax=mine drainage metagenome TaxID=410659 RepID=A0A1J5R4Z7_9ZZZZ